MFAGEPPKRSALLTAVGRDAEVGYPVPCAVCQVAFAYGVGVARRQEGCFDGMPYLPACPRHKKGKEIGVQNSSLQLRLFHMGRNCAGLRQ